MIDKKKKRSISRREFIGKTVAAAAFTIVPRFVLGGNGYTAPSDKLNMACIGVGGMGYKDTIGVNSENIYALCDVDDERAAKAYNKFPKAKRYKDFRVLLDQEKEIDAVTISTPDHTHAVAAMMAMKMGKHAYVQKPLTHTVQEARKLAETARAMKVATQMGNQGHAGEGARLINEWIWSGVIGDVYETHVWTNRPIWPQGIDRPKENLVVPSTLDWDLWQGPAPKRPYHPAYLPFSWRGWLDYGTGALGDMGAHLMDQPFWALKLGDPISVQASSSPVNNETYPQSSMVTYQFPARKSMVPVKLVWYDGGLRPPRPEDLKDGERMGDNGGGVLFVGTKGKLSCGTYGSDPVLLPEARMKDFDPPPKTIPRSAGIREEWIAACKTGSPTTSNFDYAGKLTETMLLGCIALRIADKNTTLQWDGPNMRFTNLDMANRYIDKKYRKGWSM